MHSLLRRQLKKHFNSETPPPELAAFLNAVEEAYGQADADRRLLERSLELSSRELMQANADLRAIFQAHPDLFIRLDAEGRILDTRGGARRDFGFALEGAEGTRVTELPNAAIASLTMYSRSTGPTAARPSPRRENGVGPEPLSWISRRRPCRSETSPNKMARPSPS